MNNNQISKQRLSIIIMLFSSFAVLLVLADRAPMHLENRFTCVDLRTDVYDYVSGVTEVTSSGPYVYRVLIPYLATGIISTLSFTDESNELSAKVSVVAVTSVLSLTKELTELNVNESTVELTSLSTAAVTTELISVNVNESVVDVTLTSSLTVVLTEDIFKASKDYFFYLS